ncbi:MAG TPA: beta-N-acetylhexosaminidase, partial [Bacilli bacterium]
MLGIRNFCMLLLLLCFILPGCSKEEDQGVPIPSAVSSPNTDPVTSPVDPIAEQIKQMTLSEKIGQMMIVGVEGLAVDTHTRELIDQHHVGGFILYKENIEDTNQTLSFLNELKAFNKGQIPLFLSVDQEGGKVNRMPEDYAKIPANQAIGKINQPGLSFRIGVLLAKQVKSVGFNMNYAPVLDINSNAQNPVIGDRSYGSDEEVVSKLGVQTMLGIQSQEVVPVVKHFPGHGDTAVDSHLELPTVNKTLSQLRKFELLPFAAAIKNKADVVMIAHILLPHLDPDHPASFSKRIITGILREEMQFEGVVITDDMTMGGIVKHYDIKEAAVQSIQAGSDVIMVAHGYETAVEVINYLVSKVESGTIAEDEIDQSVYRILQLKKKYGLVDQEIT